MAIMEGKQCGMEVERVILSDNEGERVGFVSCPLCGCVLMVGDAVLAHSQWHLRQHRLGVREESPQRFHDGDRVRVVRSGVRGRVIDHWQDEGHLHCYTVRITPNVFFDLPQDALELPTT